MSSNAEALEKTLAQLRSMGRLEEIDAARVRMLQTMAATLDGEPWRAPLWKEYRSALKELIADDSSSAVNDALAAMFGEVRDTPPA
jgi:hypothetical protein